MTIDIKTPKPNLIGKMRLVTSQQMQDMDRYTIEKIGVPGIVLMENAARSWVAASNLTLSTAKRVFVFCGAGNNGGDGYAIARILSNMGFNCRVVAVKPAKSADCQKNAEIWSHYGDTDDWETFLSQSGNIDKDDVVVDAVLGTGIESDIKGSLVEVLETIDNLDAIKIAVDIPSGINASTGDLLGVGVKCHRTITFQKEKIGHHLYPGKLYSGSLQCQKISIQEKFAMDDDFYYLINSEFVNASLPERKPDSYKNNFGHLATWCGSSGTLGAAFLASFAGLKTGTGLTTAALPQQDQNAFLAAAPELMSFPQELITREWLAQFSALVIGCGLGREAEKWDHISELVKSLEIPVIFDADAFHGIKDWSVFDHGKIILTPHPGEFAQMSGFPKPNNNKEKIQQGRDFVSQYPITLILKGAPSIVFDHEGKIYINSTGNSGMATAGSGDVLAGMVGGLAAQGLAPLDAALLGTWLHGKCGDLYRVESGEESLTATTLIDCYSEAVATLKNS